MGKHEVVHVGGTGSVFIKHGRRPKLGSTPGDGVLDIDVSLRHADIALGADECAGLCALTSAYHTNVGQPAAIDPLNVPTVAARPVKALFREDFWYVNASPAACKNGAGELDFDTLSDLLEQVNIKWNPPSRLCTTAVRVGLRSTWILIHVMVFCPT